MNPKESGETCCTDRYHLPAFHFMGRYGRNPYRTVWIIWSNQRNPHFDRTAVGITDLQSIYIPGIHLGI